MARPLLLIACAVPLLLAATPSPARSAPKPEAAKHTPSAAYQWLDISLEATAREVDRHGARPTIISRTLAIALTAMYDAWAAYDDKARRHAAGRPPAPPARPSGPAPTRRRRSPTRPTAPSSTSTPRTRRGCAEQMRKMGLRSGRRLDRPVHAAGRRQRRGGGRHRLPPLATAPTSSATSAGASGKPYSDYTFYLPVNPPDRIIDPDRWQPIAFEDGKGGHVTPGFLTPHWYRVKPFALERERSVPSAAASEGGLAGAARRRSTRCIAFNADLTPEQKAIVEFMRDGPRSTGQSGHWLRFAQDVSRRDHYGLDQDVKLFFAVANVAFDAFIAAWEAKRFYDTSRPWTLVRHYYAGKKLAGWLRPGQGRRHDPEGRALASLLAVHVRHAAVPRLRRRATAP